MPNTPTSTPTATPSATSTRTPTSTPSSGAWVDHGPIEPIASVSTAWGKTISWLTPYQGRIFLGHGDYTMNVPNPTHLLAWDDSEGVIDYGALNTVALLNMNVIGDQLAIPYTDPAVGSYPTTSFLKPDGSIETLGAGYTPRAFHVYGSAIFNGQRYLSGSHIASSTQDGYAVWRDDNGQWVNTDFTPNSFYQTDDQHVAKRIYGIAVLNSTLYSGASNGVIRRTTDGRTWSTVTTSGRMLRPLVAHGKIYFHGVDAGYSTANLYAFDGSRASTAFSSVWSHTVGEDGNLYVLLSDRRIVNASGATVETAPANACSLARANGKWYIGTSDSRLYTK